MNAPAELQIDRDLVRWRRPHWLALIALVLAVQGALLLLTPRSTEDLPPNRPKEPANSFVRSRAPEWVALQDSTLFASANPRGFSGLAWIKRAPRTYFAPDSLPAPAFLSLSQAPVDPPEQNFTQTELPNLRELPQPTSPPLAAASAAPLESHLQVEGFSGRRLLQKPALPVQYASDAVRPSVVEALVDADGLIFSARISRSSGSRPIDNIALDLARKARFAPSGNPGDTQFANGKLIFDWSAVEPGQTNAATPKTAH